jgi:hypothetical protein
MSENTLSYKVDFNTVSTSGLESSPVAPTLAGLRANEARSRRRSCTSRTSAGVCVFYESGLSINVLYTLDDAGKRAVGFKLSEGMEVPAELGQFKFARQKSKLTGTIRGSYFVIKNEY